MQIINRGTVAKGERDSEPSSLCFPGICILPSGRWQVSFRASPTKESVVEQRTMLCFSDDRGETWTAPTEPWQAPTLNGKQGNFRAAYLTALGDDRVLATLYWVDASNSDLPFFNEETEGLLESYLFYSISTDGGLSWSEPSQIDTSPYKVPTPITGPTLLLENGDWALQFETNKPYYDRSIWKHESMLMFSRDEGKTWSDYSCAAADPNATIFYWDQRPAVLANGHILDLFWTFDRKQARYLNIHARFSKDNGRSWQELIDTGIAGQPAAPVGLKDGRIVMVYVDRTVEPQIKAQVSFDQAKSWQKDTELMLYGNELRPQSTTKASMRDAWTEMSKFSFGLPATAKLSDEEFVVVYYAGPETDLTNIEWILVST